MSKNNNLGGYQIDIDGNLEGINSVSVFGGYAPYVFVFCMLSLTTTNS